jgi:hypothetical protein
MYLVELGLDSILEDKILLSNVGPLQAVHQLSPGRYPVPDSNTKEVLPPLQNMAIAQKCPMLASPEFFFINKEVK